MQGKKKVWKVQKTQESESGRTILKKSNPMNITKVIGMETTSLL